MRFFSKISYCKRHLALVLLAAVGVFPNSGNAQDASTKWPLPPIPPGVIVYPEFAYVTNGSPSQKLDLSLPKQGRNLPLIIFIHAGAF